MPSSSSILTTKPSEDVTSLSYQFSNSVNLNGKQTSNVEEILRGSSSLHQQAQLQKTSQNVTESVPVPSSEHVAEIVGRQGCKIKALRAKTNTYIKTPIRGEAPMFVITGRKEDVMTAKREIQLAADHFSQIRARRGSSSSSGGGGSGGSGPVINNSTNVLINSSAALTHTTTTSNNNTQQSSNHSLLSNSSSSTSSSPVNSTNQILITNANTRSGSSSPKSATTTPATIIDSQHSPAADSSVPQQLQPGQIVKKVTVPYQVVGLVVGPKGSTIKRIQQNTNTYIVTPSRDSQPVFEIQGMPDNVESAKAEIENYIQLRTNNSNGTSSSSSSSSSSSTSEFCMNNANINGLISMTEYDDSYCPTTATQTASLDIDEKLKLITTNHHISSASPPASNLFKSVAASVVCDDSTTSSIWSPSNDTNNEFSIVNSLQQTLNGVGSLFLNDGSNSSNNPTTYDFGIGNFDSTFGLANSTTTASGAADLNNDPFLSQTASNSSNTTSQPLAFSSTASLSSSSSSTSSSSASSHNDMILNSIFQQHEHLLLNNTLLNNHHLSHFNFNPQLQSQQMNANNLTQFHQYFFNNNQPQQNNIDAAQI